MAEICCLSLEAPQGSGEGTGCMGRCMCDAERTRWEYQRVKVKNRTPTLWHCGLIIDRSEFPLSVCSTNDQGRSGGYAEVEVRPSYCCSCLPALGTLPTL